MSTQCHLIHSRADLVPGLQPVVDCGDDSILGGIEFEYVRAKDVSTWLDTTGQPTSPASHSHADAPLPQ